MTSQWISYGTDGASTDGWKILGQSPGITNVEETVFVSLCHAVLKAGPIERFGRCYFGGESKGSTFLCRGDYVGRDGFGRTGAWVFYGFVLTSRKQHLNPCKLTDELLARHNGDIRVNSNSNSTAENEHDSANTSLKTLYVKQKELTFAICNEDLEQGCRVIDDILNALATELPNYVTPVANIPATTRSLIFKIVGIHPQSASSKDSVVAIPRSAHAERSRHIPAWILALLLLIAMVFALSRQIAFSTEVENSQASHEHLRSLDSKVTTIQGDVSKLFDLTTEQGNTLQDVLEIDHTKTEALYIKMGVTTYTLTPTNSSEFIRQLSFILQQIQDIRIRPVTENRSPTDWKKRS